ncbi:hypothetical protein [Actinomadura sp. SCN-SB]|uniref:hypothetical protein n=1 Tax=Actinomadura sp. SCN-SB TaxID=3373092 RepID=UPI003750A5BD
MGAGWLEVSVGDGVDGGDEGVEGGAEGEAELEAAAPVPAVVGVDANPMPVMQPPRQPSSRQPVAMAATAGRETPGSRR